LLANGLHHGLFPMLDIIVEKPLGQGFVMLALKNTDERIRQDKPVSPGFLFGAMLWHEVLAAWKNLENQGVHSMQALHQAMDQVIRMQAERLAIPKRFSAVMKEIWSLQPRFLNRSGKRAFRLLEHPRFRAAYDFLLLRCDNAEVEAELGNWWTAFQNADPEQRRSMLPADETPRRRRRRGRRKPAPSNVAGDHGGGAAS
jgi:poly(A) polymerase